MMGRHHARIGLASGLSAISIAAAVHKSELMPKWLGSHLYDWAVLVHPHSVMSWSVMMIWIVCATVVLIVGSYAPDVDSKNSTLGRFVHLPLRHRGWTHTDWVIMVIVVISLFDPTRLTPWFLLGVITHDVCDELSVAGRVHFYPLGKYKVISASHVDGGETIVVSSSYRGLYTTGSDSRSESLVYAFIMAMLMLVSVASLLYVVWPYISQ